MIWKTICNLFGLCYDCGAILDWWGNFDKGKYMTCPCQLNNRGKVRLGGRVNPRGEATGKVIKISR